jgi:hypothetical protein
MLFSFRTYINKRKAKEVLLKLIDTFYTAIGMFILIVFLLISIPFVLLVEWLSGER